MTFRATNVIPAVEYQKAKQQAVQLRNYALQRSALFAIGANSLEVLSTVDNLSAMHDALNGYKDVPGIVSYAEIQEDDVTYDVSAEFTTMLASVVTFVTNIVATLPKDVDGYLLLNEILPDGTLVPRDFTPAQLSTAKTNLDAIAASIS